jgi:hypothetical protein
MPSVISIIQQLQKQVLQINENNFDEIAWRVFWFQAETNTIYRQYLAGLPASRQTPKTLADIPCLPIQFFKLGTIKAGTWPTQRLFKSSGTSQQTRSQHHLWDEAFYLFHAQRTFERFFGSLQNFHVLCLLPSYDTQYSSLVAMARYFVARSQSSASGFFLTDWRQMPEKIKRLQTDNRHVLLLGVTHALLDLAASGPHTLGNTLVMETGGMKGRKLDLTRAELHHQLQRGLGVSRIVSEYGMTELLSQAYTLSGEEFQTADAMRIILKEVNDPFAISTTTGIINVIDLANIHSCSFIETQDLGRRTANGFEVLGRVDNSEMRGCNLLLG